MPQGLLSSLVQLTIGLPRKDVDIFHDVKKHVQLIRTIKEIRLCLAELLGIKWQMAPLARKLFLLLTVALVMNSSGDWHLRFCKMATTVL
ncbi:hypothetical protein SAMN06265218_102183 [Fodinibius sediminis]|uniref:Uncharacterized protein n=1 Tax=Fodinibius sediminis TaxID=1214077 RepID=A0A521B4I2_9BACT|nr:hypothetical protein SAMN06265218_102183 [Fodinibius sediminis]